MKASHAYGGGNININPQNQDDINKMNVAQMKMESASSIYSGKNVPGKS